MSLVTRITARLRRMRERSGDGDRSAPGVPDRPMRGSGDDYRDFQASLDHTRNSGGPPMSSL